MPDPAAVASPYWSTFDADGNPISTRFLETLASTSQHVIVRVDVYEGNFIQQLPNVTGGSVTIDSSATTRRTGTITVNSQGYDIDGLPPTVPSDLLHPASGNELYVYRGFEYADGSQDLCALGVFRMSKPAVVDTGDSITITINVCDRSSYISRIKWTSTYTIQQGTDLAVAIRARHHQPLAASQPSCLQDHADESHPGRQPRSRELDRRPHPGLRYRPGRDERSVAGLRQPLRRLRDGPVLRSFRCAGHAAAGS